MASVFAHGRLRLYLLKLLDESPRHGYEIIRLLEERFAGLYAPSAGTVYPRLAKLEEEGLVTHTTEGGRKVYAITESGRRELADRGGELAEVELEIREAVAGLATEIRQDLRGAAEQLRRALRAVTQEAQGPAATGSPSPGAENTGTPETAATAGTAESTDTARADASAGERGDGKEHSKRTADEDRTNGDSARRGVNGVGGGGKADSGAEDGRTDAGTRPTRDAASDTTGTTGTGSEAKDAGPDATGTPGGPSSQPFPDPARLMEFLDGALGDRDTWSGAKEEFRRAGREWKEQARRAKEETRRAREEAERARQTAERARQEAEEARRRARTETERIREEAQEHLQRAARAAQSRFVRGDFPGGVRDGLTELTREFGDIGKSLGKEFGDLGKTLSRELGGLGKEFGVDDPATGDNSPDSTGDSAAADRSGEAAGAQPEPEWAADPATGDTARDLDRLLDRFRDTVRDAARDGGVTEQQFRTVREQLLAAAAGIEDALGPDAADGDGQA